MTSTSCSVSLPHFSRTFPFTICQLPLSSFSLAYAPLKKGTGTTTHSAHMHDRIRAATWESLKGVKEAVRRLEGIATVTRSFEPRVTSRGAEMPYRTSDSERTL